MRSKRLGKDSAVRKRISLYRFRNKQDSYSCLWNLTLKISALISIALGGIIFIFLNSGTSLSLSSSSCNLRSAISSSSVTKLNSSCSCSSRKYSGPDIRSPPLLGWETNNDVFWDRSYPLSLFPNYAYNVSPSQILIGRSLLTNSFTKSSYREENLVFSHP